LLIAFENIEYFLYSGDCQSIKQMGGSATISHRFEAARGHWMGVKAASRARKGTKGALHETVTHLKLCSNAPRRGPKTLLKQ
jgi:hypothetical protein